MAKGTFESELLQQTYNAVKEYFNYIQNIGIDAVEPPEEPITIEYLEDNRDKILSELKLEIANTYTSDDTKIADFYIALDSVNDYIALINSFCSIYKKDRKFI